MNFTISKNEESGKFEAVLDGKTISSASTMYQAMKKATAYMKGQQ